MTKQPDHNFYKYNFINKYKIHEVRFNVSLQILNYIQIIISVLYCGVFWTTINTTLFKVYGIGVAGLSWKNIVLLYIKKYCIN